MVDTRCCEYARYDHSVGTEHHYMTDTPTVGKHHELDFKDEIVTKDLLKWLMKSNHADFQNLSGALPECSYNTL